MKKEVIFNWKVLEKRKRLRSFFTKDSVSVAQRILGDYLVVKRRGTTLVGRIVETESYLGKEDDASHTYGGRLTERNKILYAEGGLIYVYFIYGKYWCFNIAVSKKDNPEAVFIRALEPVSGCKTMMKDRGTNDSKKLTNGPCRWTAAFGIDRKVLGKSIVSGNMFISSCSHKSFEIVKTKRIGVEYAHLSKDLLLRFYIKDNPFVSKK